MISISWLPREYKILTRIDISLFCLFFTDFIFQLYHSILVLLKIKHLYFFCSSFYDVNITLWSGSHISHAISNWLRAFTLFYFIFYFYIKFVPHCFNFFFFVSFKKIDFLFWFSTFIIELLRIEYHYFYQCDHSRLISWVIGMGY